MKYRLHYKLFITYANNVLNGHSHMYFGLPAGLILFLKIIPGRMSTINIIESLETISPIKMGQELMDAQHCIWMYFDYISGANDRGCKVGGTKES